MNTYERAVKHPSHYTEGRKFEPKDVIRDWSLNFNLGSALKYIARAGRKDDIVQDLKKAQEYLQFEVDAINNERESVSAPPNCRCSVKPVEINKAGEDLPTMSDLLGMSALEFICKYCKKGIHSCMMQKFRAGSKVYFISLVRLEDAGTAKKIILRLVETDKRLGWVQVKDVPTIVKNSVEIVLEG